MKLKIAFSAAIIACGLSSAAHAACENIPSQDQLQTALSSARHTDNGGLGNDMWGALVDRSGTVCAVATTGANVGDQWPGSRAIAIEKANTANNFSLPHYALSTANLYAGSQPGGFLYGITTTDPADAAVLHQGPMSSFGTKADPAVGKVAGGIVVFGGGLALYDAKGTLLGALGVSGDTSCADHNIAWKTRNDLKLDYVPAGPSPAKNDAIIYDIGVTGKSKSGFGQPACGGKEEDVAKHLPGTETAQK